MNKSILIFRLVSIAFDGCYMLLDRAGTYMGIIKHILYTNS